MDNRKHHRLWICYIISSFRPLIGGAERATEQLCRALTKDGTDVVIITRSQIPNLKLNEEINDIPLYRFGSSSKFGALIFAIQSLWALSTHLRHYKIIHVQNIDTPMLVGFLSKIILRRKLIATIHGENKLIQKSQNILGRFRLLLMRRLVDRFTAITPEMKRQLMLLGINPSIIVEIPNGIDTDLFSPPGVLQRNKARNSLNISSHDQVVLYLGRLVYWKRVDLLLDSWARLNYIQKKHLFVVGMGKENLPLQKRARELNIHVRFEGSIDDVISYLQAADVFVLPSGIHRTATYEGLSVAMIEAMSSGLAVIATDCPGNRSLIQDNHNGLLFPVESVDELTNCLNVLIKDSSIRMRLGQEARKSIVEKYSIARVAKMTLDLYNQLAVD